MKILYLHQYYLPPGGSGNDRSRSLAAYWTQQGAEVSVVTSTASFPAGWQQRLGAELLEGGIYRYRDGQVNVYVLDVPYNHMMRYSSRVQAFIEFYRKILRALPRLPRHDIIYASSTPPCVGEAGRQAARKWKLPFIFETVDVWPDVPKGMGIIRNPLLLYWLDSRVNRIYSESSHVASLSPGMRDQVLSHGVDPNKVTVSFNGTDIDRFVPSATKPDGPAIALYAGTVGVANDVSQVVRVAKMLESEPDIVFHVLGNGNDFPRVKAVADELKPTNLKFLPPVPKEEVGRLFAEASIGVVCFAPYPVLEANSANKYYDYCACGVPVVINYGGWQAEALRANDAGLSSPMGDLAAFANNIRTLGRDPAMRKRMGENARTLACREYDRRKIAADLLKIMDNVLSGRRSRELQPN